MEHIAGADNVAAADFNRGRMAHRPCGGADGAGDDAFADTGLVAEGFRGFAGVEDESGLAVDADVVGDGFGVAQVGEEREGNRGRDAGDEAEIGQKADDPERAVFARDFIDGHDVGILLF